ncbi:GTP cyclohydrolase 1 type 2/Nif3 [Syncephalis pseudoplumigaleata]|uniref:GTP cyclohydrolase 1 type 2/Nif3 n=1 Tax=Syncephalis pseudoplumigaleata TaxID=1712513 RepID=A0A4V1J1Q1_9FUNG|nr:GTP cyclohydrolase 1 type 2/Nif3 [Syncephalis pseudoplumigaleata]|eukprot:RKP25839.1 GTP cyclohydrolase 1 type 2/Nif3 [Syncephalis pseudoplumigaleata]
MTLLDKVVRAMERIAPLALAESAWDNVGVLLEAPLPRPGATRVFLTNDLTAPVLAEAQADPAVGVIVAYHPFLFSSFKRITLDNPKQAIALRCAAAGISVYSPHTALDSCMNGVNDWLASGLGTGAVSVIKPRADVIEGQEGAGLGRVMSLDTPVSLQTLVGRVKEHLKLEHVRLAKAPRHTTEPIRTIAICAGSGNSVVSSVDADVYLTGEMGHHEALAALERQTSVILCEHSNTERGYLHSELAVRLQQTLREQGMEEASVVCSQVDRDPLQIV